MKKTILLAALGLISLSALGKDKPKEEGFVFTTVKENPITSIKTRIVQALAGVSRASASSNRNCSVLEKANTIFLKCSLYTTQWLTAPLTMSAIMATAPSLRAEASMTSCSV